MNKFILFMLFVGVLSAQAAAGGNQENGEQSNEGARSTIEQQLQARVHYMKAREAAERNAEEVKTQAERAQGNAAEDLNQRSAFEDAEVMQQDHATEDLNQRSAFEDAEVMQIDTTQRYAFEESKEDPVNALIEQFSSLQIQDPIQIETRAQQNFTNFRRLVSMDEVFPTTLMHLSTDEGTWFIYYFNRSIIFKNAIVLYNIQPVLTFNGPLSQKQIQDVLKKIEDRKVNNPVQGVVFGPNVTIRGRPMSIKYALSFKEAKTPVSVGVIVDSWHRFWTAFSKNNPNNLPFDQWQMAYLGTISPEKFKLNVEDDNWQELTSFFNANQAHLNSNNFMISKTTIHTHVNEMPDNSKILSHLTDVKSLFSCYQVPVSILENHFSIFLQNNARTLTDLDLSYNKIGTKGGNILAATIASLTALTSLNLEGNNIGDAMINLADALAPLTALIRLNLGTNEIDDEGACALETALSNLTKLIDLNLSANKIGAKGARALATALSNLIDIKTLILGGNKIGNNGVYALATALSNLPNIKVLILIGNKISDDGVRALTKAFNDFPTPSLNSNNTIVVNEKVITVAKTALPSTDSNLNNKVTGAMKTKVGPALPDLHSHIIVNERTDKLPSIPGIPPTSVSSPTPFAFLDTGMIPPSSFRVSLAPQGANLISKHVMSELKEICRKRSIDLGI